MKLEIFLIKLSLAFFIAGAFCTVAAIFENINRPLADTIGYSGLFLILLFMVLPLGRWIR